MSLFKLKKNRVWRTYLGGRMLDAMYHQSESQDGHYPEVWIASTIEANNPKKIEGEGLSYIDSDEDMSLVDLINSDPKKYLGNRYVDVFGHSMGLLVKFLDSAERLTIQVHPDKEKARTLFDSSYGKTEAWYVLGGREVGGDQPHIYYGFKNGITKMIWKDLFDRQDIQGMLSWMHKIYVKPGDVFLVQGGMPHAIGAGCFILEVQEPTDYTVRIERLTPAGYEIPDIICHQGLGFDKMFECFAYEGLCKEEMLKKARIYQTEMELSHQTLISYDHTPCFRGDRWSVSDSCTIDGQDTYSVLIVTEGYGRVVHDNKWIDLQSGDQLFVSADHGPVHVETESNLELIQCFPPNYEV